VSADPPDTFGPPDPSLDRLIQALTADGSNDEIADRPVALAMFRDSRRRLRRRFAYRMSTAAAAVVLAGGIAGAYGAVLPVPVQHIAYRMLAAIGVPDAHRPSPSSGARPGASVIPPTASASVSPSVSRSVSPSAATTQGTNAPRILVLAAARARIPAGGDDVLSVRLTRGGRGEARVRVRLLERVAGLPGWRAAGSVVTDRRGDATLTVRQLTSNASFRLTAPGGADSRPVVITVIPLVSLDLAPGKRAGSETLMAFAPFGDPGDAVVLQELSHGVWHGIGEHVLDRSHQASFTVRIPRSGGREYRVVLRRTSSHGASVSARVRVAAPSAPVPQSARPRPTSVPVLSSLFTT